MQPFQISGRLETDVQDGVLIIRVLPAQLLDELSAELRRDFTAMVQQQKPTKAVLDLSRVTMISSMGVGVVIGLLRSVREQGGELVLCGLGSTVEQVFRLCRLISHDPQGGVFQTCADVDSAAAAFAAKG